MATRIVICFVTFIMAIAFLLFGHPHICAYFGLFFLGAVSMVASELMESNNP